MEGDGYLPTTHAALCAVEELSRVGIMNASLLLHVLDECERDLTGEAPNAGGFSFSKTAIFARIRDAARRVAIGVVDMQQTATYHRRWSLLQGGAHAEVIKLLSSPTGVGVTTILDIKKPVETEVTAPQPQHTRFDADGDGDEGNKEVTQSCEESTPAKLTLADVESVLGVFKTGTPKSTVSSLSNFVNRVSGQVMNEIFSEMHSMGGGEEPVAHMENLKLG